MIYRAVPRSEIVDALVHIRELYRRIKPLSAREVRAHERREAATRDLLSNLPRTNEHPTLKTLLEVSEIGRLTLDGAHRLFGYDLNGIREYDLRLNGGRTHIFESYPFDRDLPIDLPSRLAASEAFGSDATLQNLVSEWQSDIPIRVLEGEGWHQPGVFYVHVGTEDSLGSCIPPGAMALVEPIGPEEQLRPHPRAIYLLQFGNGYRCSHCVITRGKLRLFSSEKVYLGREEFLYPGAVRIAGRVRMFALSLPLPDYSFRYSLPECRPCAELILPWEHVTRDRLLSTEHKRFKRPKEEELRIREFLTETLDAKLSGRTERRYRHPTSSEPHVNALIHLTLAHAGRYTDSLRAGGSLVSDRGRFSLETLLKAQRLEDVLRMRREAQLPIPTDVWEAQRREFVEWPPLLSVKFPQLRFWDDRLLRTAHDISLSGIDPPIGAGSWMLLEQIQTIPDTAHDRSKPGWTRPIYVFRRGMQTICGYLEREGDRYALLSNTGDSRSHISFSAGELRELSLVSGIAVSV